jgi:hypothetical protein
MTLDYESDGFAVRARKLISARQTIFIAIRGRARDLLGEHLVNGRIIDFGAMTGPVREALARLAATPATPVERQAYAADDASRTRQE